MYTKILLAALVSSQAIAAIRLSIGNEFGSGPSFEFTVVADAQLRQVVESAASQIDKISRAPITAEQKLTAIQQKLMEVQAYRKTAWSRSPSTEHKLDLIINPYESFPSASEFRKRNCPQYFSTLKIDWEPTAPGEPTLRGIKRAWDNLKAICEG